MPSPELARLKVLRRAVFLLLTVWFVLLVLAVNNLMAQLQARSRPDLPFGISSSNGEIHAQDFSYNMLYLKGIRDHLTSNPYRMSDQIKIMQHLLPGVPAGMAHKYSPVAFVLAQPLLCFSGRNTYLVFTLLSAIATLLLYYFYLLPKAEDTLQLYALTFCATSIWVLTTFAVGQTPMMTTAFAGGFWYFLNGKRSTFHTDFVVAIFFWALCLKPSVAIVPLFVLLGCQAWRALAIGVGLLLVTWTLVANFYGGWWTGLFDYLHLLSHNDAAELPSYMQRDYHSEQDKQWEALIFTLNRNLLLCSSLALVLLAWMRRITHSELFQGMVWAFLLFSPYLMPSENIILCLLVVEGSFFRSTNRFLNYSKLLLVIGIMDLRASVTFPTQVDFPLKCVLFVWVLTDLILNRQYPPVGDKPAPATCPD